MMKLAWVASIGLALVATADAQSKQDAWVMKSLDHLARASRSEFLSATRAWTSVSGARARLRLVRIGRLSVAAVSSKSGFVVSVSSRRKAVLLAFPRSAAGERLFDAMLARQTHFGDSLATIRARLLSRFRPSSKPAFSNPRSGWYASGLGHIVVENILFKYIEMFAEAMYKMYQEGLDMKAAREARDRRISEDIGSWFNDVMDPWNSPTFEEVLDNEFLELEKWIEALEKEFTGLCGCQPSPDLDGSGSGAGSGSEAGSGGSSGGGDDPDDGGDAPEDGGDGGDPPDDGGDGGGEMPNPEGSPSSGAPAGFSLPMGRRTTLFVFDLAYRGLVNPDPEKSPSRRQVSVSRMDLGSWRLGPVVNPGDATPSSRGVKPVWNKAGGTFNKQPIILPRDDQSNGKTPQVPTPSRSRGAAPRPGTGSGGDPEPTKDE